MDDEKEIEKDEDEEEAPYVMSEEEIMEEFVEKHPDEIDAFLENPTTKFLIDTISKAVENGKELLTTAKTIEIVKGLQGNHAGLMSVLTMIDGLKKLFNQKQ